MNKLSETEIKKEKEKEKPIINLKAQKTDKNIFNRNFDLFKEQNKLFFSDKNKKNDIKKQKSIIDIKSLNIDNNTLFDRDIILLYNIIFSFVLIKK